MGDTNGAGKFAPKDSPPKPEEEEEEYFA